MFWLVVRGIDEGDFVVRLMILIFLWLESREPLFPLIELSLGAVGFAEFLS
jgi:hypothetical protein